MVRCSRCGASVSGDATLCSRCHRPSKGTVDSGRAGRSHELALEALGRHRDASGMRCPECGADRLRTIRADVEVVVFWAVAFLVVGIVSLVIVLVGGDMGLVIADLSTLALVSILVGVLLSLLARWLHWPLAYECPDCGWRVP